MSRVRAQTPRQATNSPTSSESSASLGLVSTADWEFSWWTPNSSVRKSRLTWRAKQNHEFSQANRETPKSDSAFQREPKVFATNLRNAATGCRRSRASGRAAIRPNKNRVVPFLKGIHDIRIAAQNFPFLG